MTSFLGILKFLYNKNKKTRKFFSKSTFFGKSFLRHFDASTRASESFLVRKKRHVVVSYKPVSYKEKKRLRNYYWAFFRAQQTSKTKLVIQG